MMYTYHTDTPSNTGHYEMQEQKTQQDYKTILEALIHCSNLCADHAEERKVQHCFREADGAMGCLERIRIEMIRLKLEYERSLL